MSYSLRYVGTTINLPGYRWVDRHSYSPVSMAITETITQAKVIEFFTEQSGRVITLAPMAPNEGFVSRADLATLADWARVAGREIEFLAGQEGYTCVFGRPAITDDHPMLGFTNESDGEYWQAVFHLIEI